MKENKNWLSKVELCKELLEADGDRVVLFIMDIDHSKDIFGQSINQKDLDYILKSFNEVFTSEYSSFSQIGRDAFAGMFTCDKDYSLFNLMQQKQTFQSLLNNELDISQLTVCMGVSIYPEMCKKKEELFSFAYDALFSAKLKGPDNIEVSTSENMKLKSLYFRKSQLDKLSFFSNRTELSESEIIRKALDDYLNKHMYEN
ncbi:hypothetical protein CN395_27925 [Priestia megaterium]|uniref:ribbon-helix-helix domain-containing protein n=1 Tax=Priestia megaterium TaxID=1404 RepID=UPI000BF478A4|nr:ribbon-helix-helix domain-containing protein [Priestia megaterium]PEU52188.1 hypothetical protein CN395_27925 [Priestia megaterium]